MELGALGYYPKEACGEPVEPGALGYYPKEAALLKKKPQAWEVERQSAWP